MVPGITHLLHGTVFDEGRSGGGNEIPSNLTTEVLDSLGTTFDFIDWWLKFFDKNYQYQ